MTMACKSSSFLLVGTQFAGGVFLTTALIMHFLADSDVTFKRLIPSKVHSFTAMFTMVDYLLTMLADVVLVHRVYHRRAFQQLCKEDLEIVTDGG